MLLGTKKTLYDHTIESLLNNSMDVSQIEVRLKKIGVIVTIQGIYKALRELISEDIVVKQKKTYSINNVWREKLEQIVSRRPSFKLSENEHMVYRFNKLEHLDMFWKHIINDIQNELIGFPVFHANSHNFWYLTPGRKESEMEYYKKFSKKQTYAFSIVGGTTFFDKKLKQNHSPEYQQFHFEKKYPFNRRDHFSIIGPYIITTRVSVSLARVTDKLYETCSTEQELAEKLEPEFKKHGSVTMTVEHNKEKAKKLRKKMSTDFHVSRELREQFDLF